MRRRVTTAAMFSMVVATTLGACSSTTPSTQTSSPPATAGPLQFPKSDFTQKTESVTTASGTHEVTYNLYEAIPYVSKPVDVTYEGMNVQVPVKIDGADIDSSNAPILLNITVGGYMSAPVSGGASAADRGGLPPGGPPSGGMPPGGPPDGGGMVSNADYALAAGYVVVTPGVRGRDNQAADGSYFGKAPAAIVDLKAAVRYLRSNQGVVPGNTDQIVSSGTSAGGALSALLGASADDPAYEPYLQEIGAADASDAIFASGDWCPITDLAHADMQYEWMFGSVPLNGTLVDQSVSKELAGQFPEYLQSLDLRGAAVGTLTTTNYSDYLLRHYLQPAATRFLNAMTASERNAYLKQNTWIAWSGTKATFGWQDFLDHVGRKKGVPAFDAFDLSTAENSLFGDETTNARHFTLYSLRHTSDDPTAELPAGLPEVVDLMNPMFFLTKANQASAQHWWIRVGTSDTDTSLTIVSNLDAELRKQGKDVNTSMYWDAGHAANEDPAAFIDWIASITGVAAQ